MRAKDARAYGFPSTEVLLNHYKGKPICPAICMGCKYLEEHDVYREGPWCPRCGADTMATAVALAASVC